MSGRGHAPNPSGVHFLSADVAAELVRSSGVREGDLVIDFGAGHGAITAPLAATGARVLAVERDPRFVDLLRRRFADRPSVRVVHADVRSVPLPRRDFAVVASIPFALSTALLSRIFDRGSSLASADVVVEWGLARRLTAARPESPRAAWWAARYQLRIGRRIPASRFGPRPRVDAAHLVARRVPLDRPAERMLLALLRAAYDCPARPAVAVVAEHTGRRHAVRLAAATGLRPRAAAGSIPVRRWPALAVAATAVPIVGAGR